MDKSVLHNISYGVYAATSIDGQRPVGCVVNSVMQVSSKPATIAMSINHDNYTTRCIAESGIFAINIFAEDDDTRIIGRFGYSTSADTDKFETFPYKMVEGAPILDGLLGHAVCKVVGTLESSTHTVFLGEVLEAEMDHGGTPMTYSYYRNVIKGKTPKNAPTYIAPEEKTDAAAAPAARVWQCSVCGHIYEGDVPFEDLPDDWTCPICGVGKEMFEQVER